MEEIKRAFAPVFCRDLRQVEPSKKGLIVGDSLRVYVEKDNATLRFLRGTDKNTRKQYTEKLDTAGVSYKVGDDFEL